MINVVANTVITRPSLRASAMAFKGGQFDIGRSTNIYQSYETGICFNKPNFLSASYYTDFTGLNTRLTKSDFGVTTDWEETFIGLSGNTFLEKVSTSGGEVLEYGTPITSETGFVVTYFNYTNANEVEDAVTFDYWDDTEAINRIRCEILTNGELQLIVNDDVVLVDSISSNTGSKTSNINDTYVKVGIIPYFGGRGILIICSTGKEIFYYDESLETLPDDLWNNTVFRIHVRQRASLSITKMGYAATATLISEEYWFNEKPNMSLQTAVIDVSKTYGTISSKTLVNNALATYTNEDTVRVKIETALSSNLPPFISSTFVDIVGTVSNSPANNTDITTLVKKIDFTFPEDNTQSSCSLTVKGIETLQDNYIYLSTPFKVTYDGCSFVRGVVSDIDYEYNVQYDLNTTPINLTIPNFWYALEQYTFKDPLVLDGYVFEDAVKRVLGEIGFPSSLCYIQSTGFTIPTNQFSINEYQFKIDIGTTAKDALVELFSTYANNYIFQFRPISDASWFIAGNPDFVSDNAIKYVFYTTLAEAKLDAFYDSDHPGRLLARNIKLTPLALEANAIYVNGQEPVTKNNIQVYKKDYNSIDHTVAIASRPKNWCGFEKPYGYANKSITSELLAERAVNHLYNKLTKLTRLVSFDCYLLRYTSFGNTYIMYPGDRILIDEVGEMTVASISGEITMHQQTTEITSRNRIKINVVAKQQWDDENEIWTYLNFN